MQVTRSEWHLNALGNYLKFSSCLSIKYGGERSNKNSTKKADAICTLV